MKNDSVKIKIAVWLTLLIALLSLFLLLFMLFISSAVTSGTAMRQLSHTVTRSLRQVSMTDGRLNFAGDFSFYQNGVSLLIYSRDKALLAGQLPVSFSAKEDFENGLTRTVSSGQSDYLVMDLWLPMGWENGVWIRGLMEAPDNRQTAVNLSLTALAALPVFMALAALGSYLIAKRAFRPLDHITSTAAAISQAKDLSRRISLPSKKDEFSRLADTFNRLFERLERSFESEKQFTADASHELRTPVSIIKGACEYALKYDETPEDRQETLAMIHRQAVKMSDLISQLLNMTRLDQGTEQVCLVPLDLGGLADSFCSEQEYDSSRLITEISPNIIVLGEAALLTRLLENLVNNAFKYGKPQGHVWVSVERKGEEALLQVRDDGIGIPSDQQEKIWNRFYQADSARTNESGAGLGLSIVQQIAGIHGGRMTLDSIPGIGSAFTLHLPVYENNL